MACTTNKKKIKKYENGNIKSIYYYGKDKKIDSSIYYYPNKEINKITHYSNERYGFSIEYDDKGRKYAKGKILKYNNGYYRIGKWHFFKKQVDSIVEYLNIDNSPYANQIWVINKENKDTIENRGNFYKIYMQDTILLDNSSNILSVNDTLKLRFYLYKL